jgi:hypothetical protein
VRIRKSKLPSGMKLRTWRRNLKKKKVRGKM